eukprot:Skav206945  [mRNA]  locus=scaffold1143:126263:131308:+ [translate_table: standard]
MPEQYHNCPKRAACVDNSMHVFAIDNSMSHTCIRDCIRYGEADHPGPQLRVGSFNPGQILGHEDTIGEWGEGIWCGSETSHTSAAKRICSKKFRDKGLYSSWSEPVPSLATNSGSLRGKAMGVANVSTYPLHPYPSEHDHDLIAMSRLLENIVHLGNGAHMFIATVYGPTLGPAHADPWAMLQKVCATAFSHAHAFRGPAIVLGDFNAELQDCPGWNFMMNEGWTDAAAFDAARRGSQPSATCRNATRKTFILINQQLLTALVSCDVKETFDFDSHPLLLATFDLEAVTASRRVWSLPSTTDKLFFDQELLKSACHEAQRTRSTKFNKALNEHNLEEAWRQTNLCFDDSIVKACVTTDGANKRLPRGCLGRGRKSTTKSIPASAPVLAHARGGDFNPQVAQAPVSIRRHVRQTRRLQTLASQLASRTKRSLPISGDSHALWEAIFHCYGYHGGFAHFILTEFGVFVPQTCPQPEYVHHLYTLMKHFVDGEIRGFKRNCLRRKQEQVLRDIRQGGSDTYASVRDPPLPPFQHIERIRSVRVIRQRWKKTGLTTILFEGSLEQFDLQMPCYFQGQEFFIVSFNGGTLLSDRPLRNKGFDDQLLWQKEVISDQLTLQQQTAQAWGEMWQRDDDDTDWAAALHHLQFITGFPEIQFEPLSYDEWIRHLCQVKKKSARGSCSYTPLELMMMPKEFTEWILAILTAIEDELGDWPAPLMIARVVMLNKGDTAPSSPLQVRPITITSRIYRTWARYRALQVISCLAHRLSPTIAGSTAGVGSDMFAAQLLDNLESAQLDTEPILGCTIDLVKCYNLVPRQPILEAMAEVGIPMPYLIALRSMFKCLRRVLELGGQTGDLLVSTTGIPEGCCFSIVAMLTLSVWVSCVLQHVEHDLTFAAYADNWTIIAHDLGGLQRGLRKLLEFVQAISMKVAEDKSWVWASHAKDRKLMQSTMPFPIKLVSTELGCDASYCKKTSKATAKKRMQKVKRVLARVRSKHIPGKFRVNMSNQLTSSLMGYGSEFTYFTYPEIRSIRASKCRAAGRAWNGCNPYLATSLGDLSDPELCLALRKCFFWRRYLAKFPSRVQPFLDKLSRNHNKSSNGPAGVFVRSMHDLGWSFGCDGKMKHNRGWSLDWLHASSRHVRRVLELSWHVKASRMASHRKGFSRTCVNVNINRAVLKKLTGPQHTDAVNFMIGKHVTNDGLSHYSRRSVTDRCPLCSCRDSRLHRIFECEALADLRQKHSGLIDWLRSQDATQQLFAAWESDLQWADKLLQDSEIALPTYPVSKHDDAVVFTDGSAMFTGSFTTARGAGAFVCCKGNETVESKACVLPGQEQSAYRAEIWALLLALTRFKTLTVYSDCASMITVFSGLLTARRNHAQPVFREHADLWSLVWGLLLEKPIDAVVIHKVKAHTCWKSALDPTDFWKGQFNDKADKRAKNCLSRSIASDREALKNYEAKCGKSIQLACEFFHMWHEMNVRCIVANNKTTAQPRAAMPEFSLPIDPSRLVSLKCELPEAVLQTCPVGAIFGKRLCDYFNELQWDFQSSMGTSHHELFADFTIATCSSVPVLCHSGAVKKQKAIRTWNLPDLCIAANEAARKLTMTDQIRTWRKAMKWLLKVWNPCPLGAATSECDGLRRFGYVYPIRGFMGYPRLKGGSSVLQQLWCYFHPEGRAIHHMHNQWVPRTNTV